MDKWINIALPKGRLGKKVNDLLRKSGYGYEEPSDDNRKLVLVNEDKKIRFFQVKPSDVTIYVERGAADVGIAGEDIILEHEPDVYELMDLGIGKCRMAEAAPKGWHENSERTLRVATKFPNIARTYFDGENRDIDIIELHGSIELAPIVGLSDVIVDIVETGTTLRENDLEVVETIVQISARLIANKASFQFKTEEIVALRDALAAELWGKGESK
ncbi:MAG: ATP phosphoribosyltransferase [Eubacteriales bacterium]|nr:ATP phosphoribosyltransferase [Eubacteriales bacterium]